MLIAPEGTQQLNELFGQDKDALIKRFGRPVAKERFTLGDEATEANPLRRRLMPLLGQSIPTPYSELSEFHWKQDATMTSVWMIKVATDFQVIEALEWPEDTDFDALLSEAG